MRDLKFVADLAREAHAGQVDKQGRDYFEHHLQPIAGALAHLGEQAMMAGYLHDIVEDCPDWTLGDLRSLGIPEEVVSAVDSVTRRDGENYEALIARACADPLGVHVKLADNAHNILSMVGLAATDPGAADRLLKRYLKARDELIAARTRMKEARVR